MFDSLLLSIKKTNTDDFIYNAHRTDDAYLKKKQKTETSAVWCQLSDISCVATQLSTVFYNDRDEEKS